MATAQSATPVKRTGVVAMLDSLGTRRGGAGKDADSFVKAWSDMYHRAKVAPDQRDWAQAFILVLGFAYMSVGPGEALSLITAAGELGPVPEGRRVLGLADTLLVTAWGPEPPERYLPTMASYLGLIFNAAIEAGLPLRGAVSIGEWVELSPPEPENVLLVGQAVDDAADWYDKADWLGVALTPRAGFGWASTHPVPSSGDSFVEYDVPLKIREWEHDRPLRYALNWPKTMSTNASALWVRFSRGQIPPEATRKYHETARFFRKFAEKNAGEGAGKKPEVDSE